MIVRKHLTRVPVADFGDGLIQFPQDSQAAVAALDADWKGTDSAVGASTALSQPQRDYWDSLYATWRAWADPVLSSWAYNPLGAAAFVKASEITDWRAKLQQQQASIKSAGVADVPTTLASAQDQPFSLFGLSPGMLIGGALGIGVLFILVPRLLPKR